MGRSLSALDVLESSRVTSRSKIPLLRPNLDYMETWNIPDAQCMVYLPTFSQVLW